MPNQKLLDYIKDCRNQGFSQAEINEALVAAGWSEPEIKQGLAGLATDKEGGKKTDKEEVKKEEQVENKQPKKRQPISKFKLIFIIVVAIFLLFGLILTFSHYY